MARSDAAERIPFWRNVKTIGILAQVVFVILVLAGVAVLAVNVSTALSRSNLPADFGFMDARAGIPIAERPIPYEPSDPYWRALLIGFLNTLKVSLVGVVFASILGVGAGVARLSPNWLLRQVATWYVEILRNTPLAVQIIFWYTAALATVPPNITAPIRLPGGMYFSNRGLAFPFAYPGYGFDAWLPWLAVAVLIAGAGWWWRRQAILRSDRPGRAWPWALALLILIAGIGYAVSSVRASPPDDLALEVSPDRGRGLTFLDRDGNGRRTAAEPRYGYARVLIRVERGVLEGRSQNLIESRALQHSALRFPILEEGEFESYELHFLDPGDAERFSVHWLIEPTVGRLYVDANGDGEWQRGEEVDPETNRGYRNVRTELVVEGFERILVSDRDGSFRFPSFTPPGEAESLSEEGDEAAAPAGAAGGLAGLFAAPADDDEEGAALELDAELLASGALVWSTPTVPVSNYEGGFRFTPSYLSLLLALVIYTSSFIAEIVRGGLQAVPRGQTEASQALGLSARQTFSLIVFPQAVRIVLPPMISQYLNLTKNSSLGPLAAYGELFAVSTIVANQTGASVPVTVLIIASYLLISFVFAFFLNIVNARLAIVER